MTRSLDFNAPGSYASGTVNTDWTSGQGWTPIGQRFIGTLNGNGKTISNMFINRPGEVSVGLFASLDSGDIHGIGLLAVSIKGGRFAGGAVGTVYGMKPSISDSFATGSVSGSDNVGGLAGFVYASKADIRNSHFAGTVSGQSPGTNVGGLLGRFRVDPVTRLLVYGAIRRSHATGTVSAQGDWCHAGGLAGQSAAIISGSYADNDVSCAEGRRAPAIGGLVGTNNAGVIRGSYSAGNVSGTRNVGGLAGTNSGTIIGSFATGDVSHIPTGSDDHEFGGLVGNNWGLIAASYATGSVTGPDEVGGLVGSGSSGRSNFEPGVKESEIIDSFATGRVSGTSDVGGLMGTSRRGTFVNTYWDTQTTNQQNGLGRMVSGSTDRFIDGPLGKTTAELQSPVDHTGIYADWDLKYTGWHFAEEDLWDFGTSSQYPALKADVDGDGIASWQEFGSQRGNAPVASGPAPEQVCEQTVEFDQSIDGIWADDCLSASREGSYARYYTFSIEKGGTLYIELESEADSFLHLLAGEGKTGQSIFENDDSQFWDRSASIGGTISAGSYTIEATTYHAWDGDAFTLTIIGIGEAAGTPASYDSNGNGVIELSELFVAIDDYFAGEISLTVLFDIIDFYFSGDRV